MISLDSYIDIVLDESLYEEYLDYNKGLIKEIKRAIIKKVNDYNPFENDSHIFYYKDLINKRLSSKGIIDGSIKLKQIQEDISLEDYNLREYNHYKEFFRNTVYNFFNDLLYNEDIKNKDHLKEIFNIMNDSSVIGLSALTLAEQTKNKIEYLIYEQKRIKDYFNGILLN